IVESDDGPALGRVTLIPRGSGVWEAGITLSPAAQGRGLAYGAMAEALDHIFDGRSARRVFADIDPDNTPSIQLFERLGFQHEGRLRAVWVTHLGVRDSIMMGLIDGDPKPWRG
ncbi:MAG: GNAT family protein, partial [Pseudomonadota bacterium]